jgi:hypothetical protein
MIDKDQHTQNHLIFALTMKIIKGASLACVEKKV